jgi:hydrogenase large subunit
MSTRVVVDPVTRIEGHLRIEAMLDEKGVIRDAMSTGTMWRGIEVILKGRDPRDAWAFTERICGVCTSIHALASVRCVENALGIQIPPAAASIRAIMYLVQQIQDHVTHFYQLQALDWVDVVSALKADPAATSALAQKVSPGWYPNDTGYFKEVAATLKRFVESGQLGIFANAYWGHPAYRLPPEANLMAVAHYLEALKTQKEIVKIQTVFGGKNPHPNYLVGGMPCTLSMNGDNAINMDQLNLVGQIVRNHRNVVEKMYYPDVLAVASFYPEWTKIGGGLGNYLAYGDLPANGRIDDVASFRMPRGALLGKDLGSVLPVNPTDPNEIQEAVDHSWYEYPAGASALNPWDGVTKPNYTGPKPPFKNLDEKKKYSYIKGPRWKGNAMEVGPLARMLIGYASGRTEYKDVVGEALGALHLGPDALFSTIGRTAARVLETRLCAAWLVEEYEGLIAHIKAGQTATADTSRWSPSTWPAEAKGFGFVEAPRGALGHWIRIKDGKIANYQAVVPTTWNGSPRDEKGQLGAFESSLLGTPMVNPKLPLEILRTIHSFDPCLACATHVHDATGAEVGNAIVVR